MASITNFSTDNFRAICQQDNTPVYFFFYEPVEVYQPTYDEEGKETGKEDTGTANYTAEQLVMYEPTYDSMVTRCIEVKYSLDAQVALLYNYQSDAEKYTDEMKAYQEWRTYCKDACKQFFGIE